MSKAPKFDYNREPNYWDKESVADHLGELEPVEVTAKFPLEHTLSVRISKEDLEKLRQLGKESGIGTTTMARFLLRQALKQPTAQLAWAAMQDESVKTQLDAIIEEGKIPVDSPEPIMYFISSERLKQVALLIQAATAKSFCEALLEFGKIKPNDEEYQRLKEKELTEVH